MRLLLLLSLATWSVGCSGDGDGGTPAGPTLRQRLESDLALSFDARPDSVTVHSSIGGSAPGEHNLTFGLSAGDATLRADAGGQVLLRRVDLDLTDIEISAMALPPDGLVLTEVHAALGGAAMAPGAWTADDQRVTATLPAELLIDWSILGDTGAPVPLAQQLITNASFDLTAEQDEAGSIAIAIVGVRSGDFFTWSDLVTLSELSMLLSDTVPAP